MRKRHLGKNSLTVRVLEEVVDTLDLFMTFGYKPGPTLYYGIETMRRFRNSKEEHAYRRAFNKLQTKKLIQVAKTSDAYSILLTEAGAIEYFRRKVLVADLLDDNECTLVVFDIPETERSLRKKLREFLKEAGFINIQRSVWISPFDVGDHLSNLLHSTNAQQWVIVYKAKRLNRFRA